MCTAKVGVTKPRAESFAVRAAEKEDAPTLWTMLMHAAHETSLATVKANPELGRYVDGWGRVGDLGVLAVQADTPVGAAWVRLWPVDNRGYGHVADDVPELAIAVIPEIRGQGIGTALLEKFLLLARNEFPAVSLSIRADNPALRLYERHGFVPVPGSELTNRAGSVSFSMICKF